MTSDLTRPHPMTAASGEEFPGLAGLKGNTGDTMRAVGWEVKINVRVNPSFNYKTFFDGGLAPDACAKPAEGYLSIHKHTMSLAICQPSFVTLQ